MPTQIEQTDLISDFRKILELFDKETQIYKAQISILKDSLAQIQMNDNNINRIGSEIQELRSIIVPYIDKGLDSPINTIPRTGVKSRDINDYLCQVCLDTPRDCILEPCMHFCICSGCVKLLADKKCPICRRTIDFFQNVFIS